jgi:hypothetical protein
MGPFMIVNFCFAFFSSFFYSAAGAGGYGTVNEMLLQRSIDNEKFISIGLMPARNLVLLAGEEGRLYLSDPRIAQKANIVVLHDDQFVCVSVYVLEYIHAFECVCSCFLLFLFYVQSFFFSTLFLDILCSYFVLLL